MITAFFPANINLWKHYGIEDGVRTVYEFLYRNKEKNIKGEKAETEVSKGKKA